MPLDLFKWEDGGGLKHHCPICQTPLSHDKCRSVCLGQHVEWCRRYHCLFRKNWSSRCSACKTTDEQHEKRHRGIAEILARVKKHKAEEETAAVDLLTSPITPKTPRTPLTVMALNTVDGSSPFVMETPKSTKKERKAIRKAAKARSRTKVVTTADVLFVAETLHPDGGEDEGPNETKLDELSDELEIKLHLKYNNSTWNHKSARHDFIVKDREQADVDESAIDKILSVFEVDRNATGQEGELVSELVAAIENDLAHFRDELRIISRNRGGFWRWATKKSYRELVENGKDWDAKNYWEKQTDEGESHALDEGCGGGTLADTMIQDTEIEDDAAASRNGSVECSISGSTDTALTVPSSKPSNSKTPAVAPVLALAASPAKTPPVDTGWTKVGTKVLKPQLGKLTLASNGGLHHLVQEPKKGFWALPLDSP